MGMVLCFVRVTPKTRRDAEAFKNLGLPQEPQRFAIVQAFAASEVQQACKGAYQTGWAATVAKAMVAAQVIQNTAQFRTILRTVNEGASVLRVASDSRVKLSRRHGTSGSLQTLAIPVSSNYEDWYHKDNTEANWHVAPVVLIEPRRMTIKVTGTIKCPKMKSALEAVKKSAMYFVNTYSTSNMRIPRR